YEKRLYQFFDSKYPHLLQAIASKKQIDMELDQEISQALQEFNQIFKEEIKGASAN
ncbi:MAG: hypothetical protein H5U07_02255, partial [Candidatus Aminicenantes bacterium]|nr:hypothetical protein [Candidatus Aminicenantes bacterium]